MEDKKPYISIVMSIYNSAASLNYSIDSLVYQTLENIEIILVDKESTDDSGRIIDRYAENFPDKVRAFHIGYSPSPGAGWNYAISVARADYIAFCDADDAYDLEAMRFLYEIVSEQEYDMVFYSAQVIKNNRVDHIDKPPDDFTKKNLILGYSSMVTVWNKLWNKKVFALTGPIPDTMGCDVSYCPAAISNSEKFFFCRRVLYNYIAEGGNTTVLNKLSFKYLFTAWDSVFSLNYDRDYKDHIMAAIAYRICIGFKVAPRYSDDIIRWIKEHKENFIDNPVLQERADIYARIMKYIEQYECFIPKTVYVNGFNGVDSDWLEHIREKSFNFSDGEIVVLNGENCDCSSLPVLEEALAQQRYDLLGHYFALKKIAETGGFYVGRHIKFNISLNSVRALCPAVFSFENEDGFTDEFFGAYEGAQVINDLLFTYENDFYEDRLCPLRERLDNILCVQHGCELNGREQHKQTLHTLSPDITVFDCGNGKNLFTLDMSEHFGEEDYVVVSKSYLYYLSNNSRSDVIYRNELNSVKKQLKDIKSSDSYKFAGRLKRLGNTRLGRIPKRIFKWFLKKYRKHKYGRI